MASVEVTITGMLYDKLARTSQNVVLIGEASLTGLGVGGGPIIPPAQPPGGGGSPPRPAHPIALPGDPWWPEKPDPIPPDVTVPPPGSPPVMVGGDQTTHPIVAPPFVIIDYPGMGKVLVPKPLPPEGEQK